MDGILLIDINSQFLVNEKIVMFLSKFDNLNL
jgi:hypothetical protein